MTDLISIIVPVYKVEDYLCRCIDSLLIQTYKNIEIILVDDGSPDNCGDICEEYGRVDKRVRIIHKENGGLSDARNHGIDLALGKYYFFLDSDDWVDENIIERLYSLILSTEADIAVCNFMKVYSDEFPERLSEHNVYQYSNVEALKVFGTQYGAQMGVAWGKLYNSKLFDTIRYPLGKIHEDEFTTYKLIYGARKVVFTTESLMYYWQRADSIMGTGFKLTNTLHAIEALEERLHFYDKEELNELKPQVYRMLFGHYEALVSHDISCGDKDLAAKFQRDYRKFVSDLKRSDQPLKYKLYYLTYYNLPLMIKILDKLRRMIRGRNMKNGG